MVISNDVDSQVNSEFRNLKITADEVIKAVQNAKNNKSPEEDNIINEYISASINHMIDIYVLLFNMIFVSGILPEVWLIGNIIPIFKN